MLREGTNADHVVLGEVMHDAVRNGPSRYTESQRATWVPTPRSGPDWSERLGAQTIVLDETDGEVRGFMTLAKGGYVDFAYVRPAHQGTGLFRRLFAEIERRADARGLDRLWVHASLMAQPAFAALGFEIVRKETVYIGDVAFDRFEMQKHLADGG